MDGADTVEVVQGLREDLMTRHKKDRQRADQAWEALVDRAPRLTEDPFPGTQIPEDRLPRRFEAYGNLWKLDLPHAFRAVYTVLGRPSGGIRVAIEWIGDHGECERLFGYG